MNIIVVKKGSQKTLEFKLNKYASAGADIIIKQGDNEIMLTQEELSEIIFKNNLVRAYKDDVIEYFESVLYNDCSMDITDDDEVITKIAQKYGELKEEHEHDDAYWNDELYMSLAIEENYELIEPYVYDQYPSAIT